MAPWFAAQFGVQPVLIGSGLVLTVLALLSFREAAAIDRMQPVRPTIEFEGFAPIDEPKSPNP